MTTRSHISLADFLSQKKADSSLSELIVKGVAPAVSAIRREIEASQGGYAGSSNASGESQLALDVISNDIMVSTLTATGLIHSLGSEELENALFVSADGQFTVAFDPLDGSSLVDANFAIGTIFGVYPGGPLIGQKGRNQVAAGVVTYGPKTTMLLAMPGSFTGVHKFEYYSGTWLHISGPLEVAPQSKYFAPGNVRAAAHNPTYLSVINDWIARGLTLRYSGGMVPDIAHIFAKGSGIFTYPGYSEAPNGKLRLLFECNPISLLIEAAGGTSTNGRTPVLDLMVETLHQRTPIFCGSTQEVTAVASQLAR